MKHAECQHNRSKSSKPNRVKNGFSAFKLTRITITCAILSALTISANAQNHSPEQVPSFELTQQTRTQSSGPQRYIVRYKEGRRAEVATRMRSLSTTTMNTLNNRRLIVARMSEQQAQNMASNPAVESVEIDPRRYRLAQSVPYGVRQLQADQLSPFGAPRKVCIIDSGYDFDHPDLPKVNVTGEAQPQTGSWQDPGDSHGTHVAGTIAAVDNSEGVVGVHPGSGLSLHIVKVFDDNGLWTFGSDLIAALDSCIAEGANVVSMSLGGPGASSTERLAFEDAWNQGVLSVAASGNDGDTSCSYPACYDSVVSVAAIDRNKNLAQFSQRNSQVELSAAGVGVESTVVDGGYASFSGTSMATPHVAGAAALLWSLHDQCSNTDIRQALNSTAEDLGATGRDNRFGFGLVRLADADATLVNAGCGGSEPPPPPSEPEPEPPETVVLENGVGVAIEGSQGTQRRFEISIPAGATNLEVVMNGGSGDADLHLREGQEATLESYDCRPYINGNNERCAVDAPNEATYFVLVNAYREFSGATLTATWATEASEPPDSEIPLLDNGVGIVLDGISGDEQMFRIEVPAGATDLDIVLSGGNGDADLHVRAGAEATLENFDCRPYRNSNNESCDFASPVATTYFVLVHAYRGYAGATLTASYTTAGGEPPAGNDLENGVGVELAGAQGSQQRFQVELPDGARNLRFELRGGTGDADLYVRGDEEPQLDAYDCRPYRNSNNELCGTTNPVTDRYFVLVNAFSTFEGATLTVTYD